MDLLRQLRRANMRHAILLLALACTDGTAPVNLNDYEILFAFVRPANAQSSQFRRGIGAIGADGLNERIIRELPSDAVFPMLSADGKTLIYSSETADQTSLTVYAVNLSTGETRNLLNNTAGIRGFATDWLLDGSLVLMNVYGTPVRGFQIATIHADGSDLRVLTTDQYDHLGPQWSPDGKRIAFWGPRSAISPTLPEIWTMAADGSQLTRLTDQNETNLPSHAAVWSPDGSELAFARLNILFMSPSGAILRSLAFPPSSSLTTAWSPDGKSLILTSGNSDVTMSLVSMDVHTGQVTPLTGPNGYSYPRWVRRH